MKISARALGAATLFGALALPVAALANGVTATLAAQYFEVQAQNPTDPDFHPSPWNTPNVTLGSSLGPHGMPVATSPYGVNDVNSTTHEITWWSPTLNSHVAATGTGTISLPFASNMYPPNSTGTNDTSAFETAMFSGVFDLANSGTVQFKLGSDDDSFIYVDGTLFGQNPGIHGVTDVDFTSPTLGAGQHSIDVFFADREHVGAYLSLDLLSSDVVITPPSVPEPGTLLLFGGGLLALAFARRRKLI